MKIYLSLKRKGERIFLFRIGHTAKRCFVCRRKITKRGIKTDMFKYHNSVLKQITVCGLGPFRTINMKRRFDLKSKAGLIKRVKL